MADDEAWERAITAATTKSTNISPKTITLDGAVKSRTGRLPSPPLLERFADTLEDLSIAGARLSSLSGFPRLPSLRRLGLADNRLASVAPLAGAGLDSLRELDLSGNRVGGVEEVAALKGMGIEVLDLYQCPVTKVDEYRVRVFEVLKGLRYLDGVDKDGNERVETDDDDEDKEEEDEEEEEDDEEEGNDDEDEEDNEDEDEKNEDTCGKDDDVSQGNNGNSAQSSSTLLNKRKRDGDDLNSKS